jgi:uncharacterized membrane protein
MDYQLLLKCLGRVLFYFCVIPFGCIGVVIALIQLCIMVGLPSQLTLALFGAIGFYALLTLVVYMEQRARNRSGRGSSRDRVSPGE